MALNRSVMYAVSVVLPTLALMAVVARFSVRRMKRAALGADDWTCLAGLVGTWSIVGLVLAGTGEGVFGTHTAIDPTTHADILAWQDHKSVEYEWIVLILFIPTIALIKLSVIFLYRRIFTMSRIFNVYSIVLIAFLCAWMVAFLCSKIFICGLHPTAAWTSAKAIKAYCDDTNVEGVAFCVSDLVMDLLILLSPVPMIWQLITTFTRKLQIMAVFALGFLSTAGSAVRLNVMVKVLLGTTLGYRDIRDQVSLIMIWTIVEVSAGLIACCLPTLRAIFSDKGLSSVVNSIRSALSLHSLQSRTSQARQEEDGIGLAHPEATAVPTPRKSESQSIVDSEPGLSGSKN